MEKDLAKDSKKLSDKLRVTVWDKDLAWIQGQESRMNTTAGKKICEIIENDKNKETFAIFRLLK